MQKLLRPLQARIPARLLDTEDAVARICGREYPPDVEMVTFDVEALYPSIPHDLAVRAVLWFVDKVEFCHAPLERAELEEVLKFTLRSAFCRFEGTIYHQVRGGPMGDFLSPLIADILCAIGKLAFGNVFPI